MSRIDVLGQDLRHGLRLVRRAPQLNIAVILTLALGIGLNAVVFSFFNGLLFRPHVSRDPASFVRIYAQRLGAVRPDPYGVPTMMTPAEWRALRNQSRTLSAVTASKWATFTVDDGVAANLRGLFVSCNFLSAHVGHALLGRMFADSDCSGGEPVAIVSERAWSAFFNRDPGLIGRAIKVSNRLVTVVGVVPDDTVGDPGVQMVFVPYTLQPLLQGPDLQVPPDRHAWLNLSGRLAPGSSANEAGVELNAILDRFDRARPGHDTHVLVSNGALINEPGRARVIVGLVLTATTLVLFLVCANVTTLLLTRAEARRREMALRLALGASRSRLIVQLWIEGTVPAVAAAALSLGLAYYLPDYLARALAGFPLGISLAPDWRVFAYTLSIALLAGSIAAVSPALSSLRTRNQNRANLIAQQLAVSLALLVAMGLVWHAQDQLRTPALTYNADRILVANLDLSRRGYSARTAAGFYSELSSRMEALPGVRTLAVSTHPSYRGGFPTQYMVDSGEGHLAAASSRAVSPNYFNLLGLTLVRGRVFSEFEAQSPANPRPVVVSESLMRSLAFDEDTIDGRVRLSSGESVQIVGVVADTSTIRVGETDGPVIYEPITASGRWSRAPTVKRLAVLLELTSDPRPVAQAFRAAVTALDSQVVVVPETIAETITAEASRYQTVVSLTAILAGLALFLALVGIFGVTSFVVMQRMKEIGIRVALGARPADVVRLFVWSLRRSLAIGFVGGTLLAALGGWWLQYARLLPLSEAGNGLWIYGAALLLLVGTAGSATAFPALSAARANPWHVLKNE